VFAIIRTGRRGHLDRIRAVLSEAGHAWTRPRATVLQVLVGAATPLKVEEIHERLDRWPGGRGINLCSVYRTVNLLQGLRVVRRIQLGQGAQRFELAEDFRAHHHHFVCEACGRIEDVARCPLEGADLGSGVRSHHLELFGLCRGCTREEARDHVRV
jgi:Fe2+ or Zn2+ uptake regulation protein